MIIIKQRLQSSALCLVGALMLLACSFSEASGGWQERFSGFRRERRSQLAARRAADDSRPLDTTTRTARLANEEPQVVIGKFKAPAPEQVYKQRVAKTSNLASQTLSASFKVADRDVEGSSLEKTVHGIHGGQDYKQNAPKFGRPRKVSAQIMVSDEGMNLPPSKLSADIYGNVAEIVTAPPESVDSDFLQPPASKLFGRRP